jgi:hypothetical protein
LGSSTSNSRRALPWLTAFLALVALLPSRPAQTQTDVDLNIRATGNVKSPLLLARFRGGPGAENMANGARDVARHDFELSGVFAVRDVEALAGKLEPDPSQQGTVRVEGTVESSGSGLKFTGTVYDVGTGEQVFQRI